VWDYGVFQTISFRFETCDLLEFALFVFGSGFFVWFVPWRFGVASEHGERDEELSSIWR